MLWPKKWGLFLQGRGPRPPGPRPAMKESASQLLLHADLYFIQITKLPHPPLLTIIKLTKVNQPYNHARLINPYKSDQL